MHEVYLDTVSMLGELLITSGEHGAAIRLFQEALLTEPAREELHRALMQAFLRVGRPQDARAQFEQCTKILREEIGVSPTPETASLAQSIERVSSRAPSRGRTRAV